MFIYTITVTCMHVSDSMYTAVNVMNNIHQLSRSSVKLICVTCINTTVYVMNLKAIHVPFFQLSQDHHKTNSFQSQLTLIIHLIASPSLMFLASIFVELYFLRNCSRIWAISFYEE